MIGDRLEARLRLDPDGDPRHRTGLVWDRLGRAPVQRVRRPALVSLRPIGALLLAVLLIGFGIVVRPIINPPGATPEPTPTPTPLPSFSSAQIKAIIDP